MNGERDVHFGSRDQIHGHLAFIKNRKHLCKKAMRDRSFIRMHVDNADFILDRHSSGPFRSFAQTDSTWMSVMRKGSNTEFRIWHDDRAVSTRVLDVLDADWDWGVGVDDLVHGEVVDDF